MEFVDAILVSFLIVVSMVLLIAARKGMFDRAGE